MVIILSNIISIHHFNLTLTLHLHFLLLYQFSERDLVLFFSVLRSNYPSASPDHSNKLYNISNRNPITNHSTSYHYSAIEYASLSPFLESLPIFPTLIEDLTP